MAEEEVVAAASPAPSDHKRKLEDLEPEAPEPPTADSDANPNSVSESDSVKKAEEEIVTGGDSDGSEAKRPRLEDKPDDLATRNGYQEEKVDEPKEEVGGQPQAENSALPEDAQQLAEEASETGNNEKPAVDYHQMGDIQQPLVENPQLENPQEEISKVEFEEPPQELQEPPVEVVSQQGDVSFAEQQPTSEDQPMSRKMEVPNTKVGVLIGKAGDTIRYLQYSSGAKIQIMRDADADPDAATRPVELLGTLENINKAEKLINDVIAEADAGGSPSLVARGFSTVQSPGVKEQIEIQVPNEKVGSIIGKGGETIKNLQTRSGARIQLIPQHLPEGDQSKERTVRVTGDKKQIEVAREMIKEVMNQPPIRRSPLSSGYNQQAYRPRGPSASQWGPRGPHPAQPTGYDYPQRGPYPSHNPQYPPPSYGNYPAQQMAPRSNFGWDQRPQATMQAPPPQGGYDYYGGQGGHTANAPPSNPTHTHVPGPSPAHAMGPPPSQANYNYGQQQGPDYGQPTPYSQTAPPAQSYGHGYNETKYENQAPQQHQYGGHGGPQPSTYPQGYGQQEQYGKPPPSYGVPPQGSHAPSYGQPRANQPGDIPYQGPVTSTQSYGPNAAAQQPYPYASSGPTQQTYPPYGSVPAADGYSHPPPAAASTPGGYPQQAGQPVSGYGQPGGQQGPGYAQVGPTQNYSQYPSSQPGYTEQAVPNNAGYGYQGPTDPAYGSGPGSAYGATTGQQAYSQPAPTQPGYDQSIPQPGAYGSVPGNVPVGYGKSLSPQPGYAHYDASQMYGAQR